MLLKEADAGIHQGDNEQNGGCLTILKKERKGRADQQHDHKKAFELTQECC